VVSESIDDRGQALPLMLIALAVALIGLLVLSRVGLAADDAARARTAADAAALAGAAEGRSEAGRLATANGGVLIEYRSSGSIVEVVVRVGRAAARARAERVISWVAADPELDVGRDSVSVVPQ
jgi:hypothetical protein